MNMCYLQKSCIVPVRTSLYHMEDRETISRGSEHQRSVFDVWVCHPNADSYRDLEPQQIYRWHENEKKALLLDESARHRTWDIHTSSFYNNWWHRKRMFEIS